MSLNTIQSEAIEKLKQLKAGALFMSMGTGKTKVALDLAISRQDDFDTLIWIAPASLIRADNYAQEIAKWSGSLKKPIRTFTVESISQSSRLYLELRTLAETQRTFCVVDESITIKNAESKRTTRLLAMWDLFTFRLILNGTPVSKNLADLYPQIRFLHPSILDMSEREFAEKFLCFKDEGFRPWQRWSKPVNEAALIEIIRPYIFDAQLEIDATVSTSHRQFSLDDDEGEAYEAVKLEYLDNRSEDQVDFLALAQLLQGQYTLCDDKIRWLVRLVDENPDEQFVIYVKFLKEIERLREELPTFLEYTGQRKDSLEQFVSGESRLLVMTYGSGSMGLNLQNCRNVVFFSQTFDQKDKIQALHRVYRTGQERDVNEYQLWVRTGLEEIIRKSLRKKESTLKNLEKFIAEKGVMAL
jgi:SNF2 family DNA or RNA helicase